MRTTHDKRNVQIYNESALTTLKRFDDLSLDLIFCDPPYALGSTVVIKENGKPDYDKAVDFMSKWKMPTADFWEEFFETAVKKLEYGGYCIMFGMDRQNFMFKYYATASGLINNQSLYWYFISNFPKSSDLSKNIDKFFNEEREVSHYRNPHLDGGIRKLTKGAGDFLGAGIKETINGTIPVTAPSHPLAKKYDGYKYSAAPLKQVLEIVNIYKKEQSFEGSNVIDLTVLLIEVLKCITIQTRKKEQALGTNVSDVETDFISHQVVKYLRSGSHIAQTNADLIENILVCIAEKNFTPCLQELTNFVQNIAIAKVCEASKGTVITAGLVENLKEKMGILQSGIQTTCKSSHWNIELLWLIMLAENYSAMKMYTTSTETEVITELKIYSYYLTESIKHYTEQNNPKKENKQKLNVTSAVNCFINVITKLQSLKDIFAAKNTGTDSIKEKTQVCEEISIFQKKYKTGSCLHDTLAYENGDNTITVGAVKIKGNEVATDEKAGICLNRKADDSEFLGSLSGGGFIGHKGSGATSDSGRFPAQAFCDSGCAGILDEQSGDLMSSGEKNRDNCKINNQSNNAKIISKQRTGISFYPTDSGGCSKILHKCDYEKGEYDVFNYCPKVSPSERAAGCEGFEVKEIDDRSDIAKGSYTEKGLAPSSNNHPTLKPISLCKQITSLFKLPNPQKVFVPFSGAGSEIIGLIYAGFDAENIIGSEINPEYVEIAKARIDYWSARQRNNMPVKIKRQKAAADEHQEGMFAVAN